MKTLWSMDIEAPRAKVWRALTDPGAIQPFYFNSLLEAQLRPGGEMNYRTPDGERLIIAGKVLEIEDGSKLVHQFRFTDLAEPPQTVTFELEDKGKGTKVTIRHQGLDEAPKHSSRVTRGWDSILKNLKIWMETGSLPLSSRMQNNVMHFFLKLMPHKA